MSEASDRLQAALSRYSADQRRAVAYYGNVRENPGGAGVPRRLISDYGFPSESLFTFVVPSAAHVDRSRENRDPIRMVILHPYGLTEDRARLVSARAVDRRFSDAWRPDEPGVRTLVSTPDVIVPAYLDDSTASTSKTSRLVSRLVNQGQGPAYHFVIARSGNVLVCAALDDEVYATRDLSDVTIDIALEGAVGVRRTDWEARNFNGKLFELPFTEIQLFSLRVLLAKINIAIPHIPRVVHVAGSPPATTLGVYYAFPEGRVTRANFSGGAWRTTSPLDYSQADVPIFSTRLTNTGPYDLGTQVFQPYAPTPPVASRADAQGAVEEIATMGELSPALAAYTSLAGAERAADMAAASRSRLFVSRIHVAHRDADDTSSHGTTVESASNAQTPIPATNFAPHTYDFGTGFWGDGEAY